MALRIISNHVPTLFLVSQKVIVIQQAVSCVGISSPYSCVESDANKRTQSQFDKTFAKFTTAQFGTKIKKELIQ